MKRVLIAAGFKPLLLLLCLLGSAQIAGATTVTIPADDDMIVGARAIVRGRVLSVGSAYDEQQDRIYTYITLRVQQVIKGNITERQIVIKELGGIVGDRAMVIYGNPQFVVGERVLLFLDTWADGSLRTYQMFLGKFNIITDSQTGRQLAVRSSPDAHTVVVPRHLHGTHARGGSTERMELRAYTRMVRKHLAANLARAASFDFEHYRNVPVLAEPPEFATSRGEIQPHYTFMTPLARWHQPDSAQPIPYTLNPNPAPPDSGVPSLVVAAADVAAAAGAWSNVSGSALQIVSSGTLNNCYTITGTGGINVVSNNCDGRNAPTPGCASILAWGGWSGGFFSPTTVNGTTFNHRITQGFVSCNPWAACAFSDHCSVQYIITHEMGHALGIGHSQFSQATMYGTALSISRCAGLHSDDMDAVRFAYPGSGGGGGTPLSITTTSLPGGTTGSSYSQNLSASGGTTPYSWSIVSGFGSLPTGLTLSAGGTISGTPSAVGTYNFRVQVTDAASATATKDLSIAVTAAGTQYSSQFVSQSVSTTLNPGQTFNATLTWLNTGTEAWNGSTGLRLLSQNPPNNVTWGGNTVLLTPFFVPPGQQLSVTFTAFAPSTPGTYNFQWQVARDASTPFGQMSTNVVIQVGGGGGTNNASFVSQNVPSSLATGETVSVTVTMRNSGTTTWSPGTYKLGSQNPQDNTTWGLNRVNLSSSVSPGADAIFTFNITAPAATATYNFQWRMLQDGAGFFGASSTNVAITVSEGGPSAYDSDFISQSVPSFMTPGQTYVVSVTMRNTGTNAWGSSVGIALGSQNPQDNMTWGTNRLSLGAFVPLGGSRTFNFLVTAPSAIGIYNFQWRMFKSDIGFFGDASENLAITVGFSDVPASHPFYSAINKIAEAGITLGCSPGTFCPDEVVTRGQMAAFIIRALGDRNPPQPAQQRFADVPPTNPFYAFIEQMAVREITLGCSPGNYCPDDPVLRDQMAAFIIRALGDFNPQPPPTQRFADVPPTSPFYAFIEQMAVRGITVGCGGGNYCPSLQVTRGQMAAFLVRAFGL